MQLKPIIQHNLLFSEILWQKPLNIFQKRGRVLVLGGEKDSKKSLTFCEALFGTQIQKISLGYPEALANVYKKFLPEELHFPLPSTIAKTLSIKSFDEIKQKLTDYDLMTIGPGLSKSSETQRLINNLLELDFPALIIEGTASACRRGEPTVLIFEPEASSDWHNNPLQKLEKLVEDLPKETIVVLNSEKVFIANFEKIVITPFMPTHKEVLYALIAALWSQNIKKPLESASAAAFVTKVWQENFTKIDDIGKAIFKAEEK